MAIYPLGINQQRAITGRRIPKNFYSSVIGEQASYLPQLYAQKESEKQTEKGLGLQEQGLALEKELGEKRIGLEQEGLNLEKSRSDAQKLIDERNLELSSLRNDIAEREAANALKQSKQENLMGVADLGLKGGLGYLQLKGMKKPTTGGSTGW